MSKKKIFSLNSCLLRLNWLYFRKTTIHYSKPSLTYLTYNEYFLLIYGNPAKLNELHRDIGNFSVECDQNKLHSFCLKPLDANKLVQV